MLIIYIFANLPDSILKVLLDYFIFDGTSIGGVYRYFHNLIDQSKVNSRVEYEIGCLWGEPLDGKMPLGLKPKPFTHSRYLSRISRKLSRQVNIGYTIALSMGSRYDIFHPSGYTLGIPAYINNIKKPMALTVYDMVPELFPNLSNTRRQTSLKKKFLCEKAKIIFTISEHTKNDLIKIFHINPDKIKVTPLAGGFAPCVPRLAFVDQLPLKYLLFVGGRWGYKNLETLLLAIAPLLKTDPELYWVCTGGGFNSYEMDYFRKLEIVGKVKGFFIRDEDFYTLYNRALAFIFPSLYEGFGIPILEAFSCGCPVVASRTSSLPEVGGDAALYVDPRSETDIRKSIENLINNQTLREELVRRGTERIKSFSWEMTATSTFEGYHKILNQN